MRFANPVTQTTVNALRERLARIANSNTYKPEQRSSAQVISDQLRSRFVDDVLVDEIELCSVPALPECDSETGTRNVDALSWVIIEP